MNRTQLAAVLGDLPSLPLRFGVDVACGLGLMSELCHGIFEEHGVTLERMICADMERDVLELARVKLAHLPVGLMQSVGQRLPLRSGIAGFVLIGNGIHNFADGDKVALLEEAYRVLCPGGRLFFNSGFYDGAVIAGTERYWLDNVRGALRLAGRSAALEGTIATAADRKPEAIRPLTPEEYCTLARRAGFDDVAYGVTEMWFDQELMEAICDYWLYAQGALHFRYPAEIACPAMRQAAHDLFTDPEWERRYPGLVDAHGRRSIPRRVLYVTGRKPAAPA
jgi:ubiquinone/menaquinone biosynthesis C-methylase UbiE